MTKPRPGAAPSYERTPEHREMMRTILPRGPEHHAWKETPSYISLHEWIRNNKEKTGKCSVCTIPPHVYRGYTEWHNIDGEYSRNLDDYIEVCKSCHKKLDREGR